ncbi:31322_t:CDS:2, partial [Racocetra persica]
EKESKNNRNKKRCFKLHQVETGNVLAKSLKLYIMNIKAHNEALGFGWNNRDFDAIIKEVWNKI